MQKDFAAMAQQAPAKQMPQTEEAQEFSPQDLGPTMEQMGSAGLPTGGSRKEIKQRLLAMLEQTGLLQMFKTADQKQQLVKDMDALIDAIESEDAEAVQSNPIIKMLEQSIPGEEQQTAPQQDFASMAGGGMGGR
jgi:hypothetical protein